MTHAEFLGRVCEASAAICNGNDMVLVTTHATGDIVFEFATTPSVIIPIHALEAHQDDMAGLLKSTLAETRARRKLWEQEMKDFKL